MYHAGYVNLKETIERKNTNMIAKGGKTNPVPKIPATTKKPSLTPWHGLTHTSVITKLLYL